jgi:tetratricopeptide (TPR) repeat protein
VPRMPIKPGPKIDLGRQNALADLLKQAMTLHKRGELEQAASVYHRILRLSPKHFDATHLLAVANAQLGHVDRSRELFARALELRPSHAETHFNKGTMERAAGNHAVAAADFGRVLKLAPDHLGALNNRSLTLQRLQRFEEALSDSDRLVVLAPADPVVHNNRGALLHEMMMPSPIMTVPSPSTPISPRSLSTRASRFCFRVSLRLAGSCGSGAGNKQG